MSRAFVHRMARAGIIHEILRGAPDETAAEAAARTMAELDALRAIVVGAGLPLPEAPARPTKKDPGRGL